MAIDSHSEAGPVEIQINQKVKKIAAVNIKMLVGDTIALQTTQKRDNIIGNIKLWTPSLVEELLPFKKKKIVEKVCVMCAVVYEVYCSTYLSSSGPVRSSESFNANWTLQDIRADSHGGLQDTVSCFSLLYALQK